MLVCFKPICYSAQALNRTDDLLFQGRLLSESKTRSTSGPCHKHECPKHVLVACTLMTGYLRHCLRHSNGLYNFGNMSLQAEDFWEHRLFQVCFLGSFVNYDILRWNGQSENVTCIACLRLFLCNNPHSKEPCMMTIGNQPIQKELWPISLDLTNQFPLHINLF